jgi:hypothetical protein
MIENYSRETKLDKPGLKKYRLAGFGFLVLNILYIIVAWWKLPPIDLTMSKIVYVSFFVFIAIVLIVTPFILNGGKTLVKVLAFMYGGRVAFSIYTLIGGDAFPAVPYLLPCVMLTFYLLGRAAWDWW